jgi:NitT/TauT family transport system ATP-binding protein
LIKNNKIDRLMEIICKKLFKSFKDKKDSLALDNINFSVASGEFVSVLGPSGCGKTTLLRLIADMIQPDSGKIIFSGKKEDNRPLNAMVFQEHALFPWATLIDNAAFGLQAAGIKKSIRRKTAQNFLDKIGIGKFALYYPHQLSGGMRQRGAVARAFAVNPYIFLMDEPFSSLDAQTRLILQEELLRIWGEDKKTVVYVTHDIDEAILLSDKILVMRRRPGTIIKEIAVNIKRPRNLIENDYAEAKEIKKNIWRLLKKESLI